MTILDLPTDAPTVPPLLLGLSGKKRSGKDTSAAVLVEEFGYTRLAIADAIRDTAVDVNPNLLSASGDQVSRLAHVLAEHGGFEHVKDNPEWDGPVREFLQSLGAVIAMRDPRFWPMPVIRQGAALVAEGKGVIITDVRFLHEVDMIREAGGIVGRVWRSDIPADAYTDQHISEIALDDLDEWKPDFVIDTTPLTLLKPRLVTALNTLPAVAR